MHVSHEKAVKYTLLPNSVPQDVENNISKIKEFKGSDENKGLILAFDRQCSANGNKLATRNTYLALLCHLQQFATKYAHSCYLARRYLL